MIGNKFWENSKKVFLRTSLKEYFVNLNISDLLGHDHMLADNNEKKPDKGMMTFKSAP